jgi:aryl-alcohol dehydrogenase-like predicted oxidoreductase
LTTPEVPRVGLAPGYEVSSIIKGSWQLAGGHGPIDRRQALLDMAAFVDAGITTFDCADIYTGVEEAIGAFLRSLDPPRRRAVQVHTKYVPDLDRLGVVSLADTRRTVERSLRRLGVEQLDLVQFHWWDYAVPRFVEVALHLESLRREGLIAHIGVTNFDAIRLRELLDAGIPVRSAQVQYSLVDRRPEGALAKVGSEKGVKILAFGSLLGGFLSERWLAAEEPVEPFETRSLTKYKLVIDEIETADERGLEEARGPRRGWDAFQLVLAAAARIAAKHRTTIAAVGIAWALSRPAVAAVIVGARNRAHLEATLRAASLRLDAEDLALLDRQRLRGPRGDVYDLERDRDGRHGRIMRYNLSGGV